MVRAIAPTSMHVKAIPGDCPDTKDSHSWGRLVGGQVVDGILSICPKCANMAAWGPDLLRLGEEKQAGMALLRSSCRWLTKGALSGILPGFLGSGLTGVWWGALARQKEKWLFPSLSAELATLVSKNIKIRR